MPAEPCSAPTTPSTTSEELEVESPDSPDSQTSTAWYSLHSRLPITYNEAALSQLQGRPQVIACNNLSIPFPSNSECSTDNTNGNTSSGDTSDTDGLPCRSHSRFIMPTERITDRRDRHGHVCTTSCPKDHSPGPQDAYIHEEDALTQA